uniref:uncharacterized protein LOC122610949 n=1 Tax=Erigeron canadensis TaxID=72917 RepID=UPI001CB94FA4|nr:uncharacterized protein LOC122610949 [Erigeron canadensis]
MRFPEKWCNWVYNILSTTRSSILVNGSPTFEFQCHKSMRQGDPIAPFLFIMVMEAFPVMLNRALAFSIIKGVDIGNDGLLLSHMLYADDYVLVGEWESDNLKNITGILRVFNLCSGLKIHLGKSNLFGIGVDETEVTDMARVVNCSTGFLPFKHLGIWIGANMNKVAN